MRLRNLLTLFFRFFSLRIFSFLCVSWFYNRALSVCKTITLHYTLFHTHFFIVLNCLHTLHFFKIKYAVYYFCCSFTFYFNITFYFFITSKCINSLYHFLTFYTITSFPGLFPQKLLIVMSKVNISVKCFVQGWTFWVTAWDVVIFLSFISWGNNTNGVYFPIFSSLVSTPVSWQSQEGVSYSTFPLWMYVACWPKEPLTHVCTYS